MFTPFVEWFVLVANNNEFFCGFIVVFAVVSFIILDLFLLRHMLWKFPKIVKSLYKSRYPGQQLLDTVGSSIHSLNSKPLSMA